MEATAQRTTLDLGLAFARVRDELLGQPKTERALAANPFELELIDLGLDDWIGSLAKKLDDDSYLPGPIEVCDAPKGGGLVRPGTRLGVEDRVVYTAAVGTCINQIDAATRWSQGKCDFATRLDPAKLNDRNWLRNPYKGWREFHDRSLARLDSSSVSFVLTADVAGFFENINIGLLRSDLQRIGCPKDAVSIIASCLNHWTQCPDRGLPQGVIASDILAKLYLESFDSRLQEAGFRHMRYTDDLRLYAESEEEAKQGLVVITRILRERGLTLQSHKTQIRQAADAREEFDGIIPAIEEVRSGYIREAVAAGLMAADVSLPMAAIDDLVGGNIEAEVLHRAFDRFVVQVANPNKSMLNFLLGHLGRQGDGFATDECTRRLETHPERTSSILRYFQNLEEPAEIESVIRTALRARTGAIYPYQRYLLLDWLYRNVESLEDESLAVIRQLAFRPESPQYVQAGARRLLGLHGAHSDLEEIESLFKSESGGLHRAQLLCCLTRLEKSRRNGIAARVETDGSWVGRAASFVRR